MKFRNSLFAWAVLMLFASVMQSQESSGREDGIIRCSTVEMDAELRQKFPQLGTKEDFENWMGREIQKMRQSQAVNTQRATVYTIPVVFHVIHNGESPGSGRNLSAALIQAQIDQMNDDFRRRGAGFNTNPVGADVEIEFCLATEDNGGASMSEPGINRINRSSRGFTAPPYSQSYVQNTIKPATQWNPNEYLNIWLCDLSGGLLGYAQFPEAASLQGIGTGNGAANTDGVVVLYSSVGSVANPNPAGGSFNKGRTLTHEVGHWLGLRHIWGDGGCSVDDYVSDTPVSDAANYGCPTGHVSCSTTDMIENYMDYTDDACMNIFTQGQSARMRIVMGETGQGSVRRAILATSTKCSGGGGNPATCTATVSSFPYAESFEGGLGAWSQGSGDDTDWTRDASGTPSSGTGPAAASDGTYYMYVESSSPNYPSKTAILEGPCFDLAGQSGLDLGFDYHMYGTAMGSLQLQASTDAGANWTTIWSRSGNQGNSWFTATLDLDAYNGQVVKLRFLATTGSNYTSDITVDNITISSGGGGNPSTCTSSISTFPYSESFESGTGEWSQGTGDDTDWTRDANGTPSSGTGPGSASDGTYYMYVESSSPNFPSKTAILDGPCFDLSSATAADFEFDYHMYGAAMGSLQLQASTNAGGTWTTIWSRSGNQGNSWATATVSLGSYLGGEVKLRFLGTTGSSYTSDMTIDNLSLTTGGGADTQAPTNPTNLSASNITQTTVNLSWTASTDNVGVTGYDVYRNGSMIGSVAGTTTQVTGLTAATSYAFYVRAKDAAGNVSGASNTVNITTLPAPDTQAPTSPANLSASNITQTTVNLTWTASTDNVGVTGYDVYRNGSNIGTVTGTATQVTGLSPATAYSFYVRAKDAAGNVSAVSNTVNVTTLGTGGTSCTADVSSFPYSEGFESGLGAWSQGSGDDFNWTRDANGTPSSNTGPASATEGSWYMYVEASSPNYPSKTTILNGPCFDLTGASIADFGFAYHMYGASGMGALRFEVSDDDGATWTVAWSRSGNQGNSWQTAVVDLSSYIGGTVKVRFAGTTGNTWQGDIAIDDISMVTTSGGGNPGCTDITLSLTFDNYPEETSFEIRDASNNIWASGGTYGSQADGSTLNLTGCLPYGCYTLTVFDAYGDGMCCSYGNGSYSLTAGSTVLASGGSFGSSESTNFCVDANTKQTMSVRTTPSLATEAGMLVYPNPARDLITVRYTGKKQAEGLVQLVDMMGRVVRQVDWTLSEGVNEMDIPVNDLVAGSYILVVRAGKDLTNSSLIIQD